MDDERVLVGPHDGDARVLIRLPVAGAVPVERNSAITRLGSTVSWNTRPTNSTSEIPGK